MDASAATVAVGVLGVISTIGATLITGWLGRRHLTAQTQQITATAHSTIYESYGELITALRTDVNVAREEARGAHAAARLAEQRADAAEDKAYTADYKMRSMEALLRELRPLIAAHVPGAELWLAQLDRVAAGARA